MQPSQGREVCLVVAITWHRHVDPFNWSLNVRCKSISQLDHQTHIGRLDKVLVSGIPIAKVNAELGSGRNVMADPHNGINQFIF